MMHDLSVEELRDLHARLIGPHPHYAYQEAKARMMQIAGVPGDGTATVEDVTVSLSLRLEIVEAMLKKIAPK